MNVRPSVNVGRSVETGAILGILVIILATTGVLLSPTIGNLIPAYARTQAAYGSTLFVLHLSSATLLIAFTIWHLIPFTHAFGRKRTVSPVMQAVSYVLLLFIVVQVATGVMLYFHLFDVLTKRQAALVHLINAAVIMAPIVPHAWRGVNVWATRRNARDDAFRIADKKGHLGKALAAEERAARRQFLRFATYATAGVALAVALGRYTVGQLRGWRVNSVGEIPDLNKANYRLRVTGLVNEPIELTYAELTAMPSVTRQLIHRCVEGWTYTDTFTGVPLREVIARAGGMKDGASQFILKSPEISQQGRKTGTPYTTNFPVNDGMQSDVYLVYKVGDVDLPREHGYPVRLMTERKWGYKACKWLTEIEVTADAAYEGYWESLGYHNDGDYPGPIFAY